MFTRKQAEEWREHLSTRVPVRVLISTISVVPGSRYTGREIGYQSPWYRSGLPADSAAIPSTLVPKSTFDVSHSRGRLTSYF